MVIKEKIEKNKSIIIIFFLIIFVRYIFIPYFTPIEDITVIVTDSMEHSKYWKLNMIRNKCNLPCCMFSNNKSKNMLLIPYSSKKCKIKYGVLLVYNPKIIRVLNEVKDFYYSSLNDVIIPTNTTKTNYSFFIYEKVLNYSLLYIKYPKDIPFKNGINPGDVVIVKKVKNPCKEIKPYDVIQYEINGIRIVHRVLMKIERGDKCYFIVMGDNSMYPIFNVEAPLEVKRIKGKVLFRIPRVGIINYLIYKFFLSYFYKSRIKGIIYSQQ